MTENPKHRLAELVADIPKKELECINHADYSFQRSAYNWWFDNERLAWNSYFNLQDIESAKQYFYTCGRLDVLRVSRYDVPLFGYGRTHISYAALSDNIQLINDFSKLNYKIEFEKSGKKKSVFFSEFSQNGSSEIYCDTMIKSMAKDFDGLERNIRVYEEITSQKKKNKWMELDFGFFKAILNRDKDKAFKTIEELTKPRTHNARNSHDILFNQLVSEPALGFAKIAWLNGMEIEPTSKFIPKDLLPVKPNSEYKDDYLKYDK